MKRKYKVDLWLKGTVFFMISIVLSFAFMGCTVVEDLILQNKIITEAESMSQEKMGIKEDDIQSFGNNSLKGQEIYQRIQRALLEMETEIDLSKFPESGEAEAVFQVIEQVLDDTPEILYYDRCEYWSNGRLNLFYKKDRETTQVHIKQLNQKVAQIIEKCIQPGMADFEKALAIHDYIIHHSVYDLENFQKQIILAESYSAYGVLLLGKGTCEGYAKAMQLIMNRLGIRCILVNGMAGGIPHAWNMIELDQAYYHIDLTWNDPVTPDGSQILRYDYFNLTDEEMKKDHLWNQELYPKADATKYNYYTYYQMLVTSYDEFYSLLKGILAKRQEHSTFKITYYQSTVYDISETMKKIIRDNPKLRCKGYSYSINDQTGVITIRIKY